MGKGNRSRIERAMTETNNASKPVQAKKNKVSGAGIFVAIAAILVVVALLIGAIGVLNDGGWFARTQTAVKTENYKVDGVMMNYFFMTQFNSAYEYYYQLYTSYFSSSYKSVYELMGIDQNKSLKEQYVKGAEGAAKQTVFDYYMSMTEDYVTRLLTYCEFANKAGIALTEDDYADIDDTLKHLEEGYESQKAMYEQFGMAYYANFSAYLSATYGTGVKERDVRNCLELITLAAKFEEKLTEDKEQLLLDEKDYATIEKYVKDNPSSFLMADYYAYSFSVTSKDYENDADFEAAKKDILEQAKELAASENKDAYKATVLELLKEAELKAYREKNWDTFYKDNGNDEEKTEEAIVKSFNETKWTEAIQVTKFDATLMEGFKCPTTATELSKWIFGYDAGEHTEDCKHEGEHEKDQEPAKKGDLTYFENTSTKEETIKNESASTTGTTAEETTTDAAAPAAETTGAEESTTGSSSATTGNKVKVTTYTVTVYLLEKEAYRNTEITKHFGYVMFAKEEDAKTFFEAYSKGEMNKDTMLELIEDMHEEITPYAYDAVEDYMVGDLQDQNISKVDEWLEKAEPGDCSGVIEVVRTTTTSSSSSSSSSTKKETTYYAVLVYDQDGYEAWFCDALAGTTNEAVAEWFDDNALELTYNEKAYTFIDM